MADLYVSADKPSEIKSKSSAHSAPGHSHNPLSAYCYLPDNISFETKEKDEKVILFLRPHIITNVPWIIIATVLFLAPSVLSNFPLLSFLPDKFQVVAVLGWYLVATAFVIENFLSWFFDAYIVTDRRIVDVNFYNLIYREVSESEVTRVQDVTYKLGGVVRTMFNYGDVFIQTAGTVPNFEFMGVPNPSRVVEIVQDLQGGEQKPL